MAKRRDIDVSDYEEELGIAPDPGLTRDQRRQELQAQGNPLLGMRTGFGPLSANAQADTAAFEEEAAKLPNMLVRPPGDFGDMTRAQQEIYRNRLAEETQRNANMLQFEAAKRQEELADITRKEGLEIIKQSGGLDPTADDYHAKKNALIRQFPGGAISAEAKAIFADLDARRKTVEDASEAEKKSVTDTERLRGENNFTVARTQASELGPEFLGRFTEISKAQGPDAAIAYLAKEGARAKEASLRTQLKEGGGMTEEGITAQYGGEQIPFRTTPFQFPAAEAKAKGGTTERRQAQLAYSNLMAAKAKAKHPLTGDIIPEQWGDAEEARLVAAAAELDALTGRTIGQNATTTTTTTPAATAKPSAAPAAKPTVTTISVNDATARMGRPVSPGTAFTDKYGNRIVVQ